MNGLSTWAWMAVVVLSHFVISIVHGTAHSKAHVPLSPEANLFVVAVILAGPLIGLVVMRFKPRIGVWLIALTMAGALVFGCVNHFVFPGPDHIAHVDPQWRLLFTATAVLLALTETLGSGLAVRLLWQKRVLRSH